MSLFRSALLGLARNHWLGKRLPNSAAGRRAARKFMPGERLQDAITAGKRLQSEGISVVLTELGEDITDAADAQRAAQGYEAAFDALAAAGLETHVSVKATHLGLLLDPGDTAERISALAEKAAGLEGMVWIDMEGSDLVDRTLDLYEGLKRRHPNVGLCIQAYLRRTPSDVERLLPLEPHIRLVKGTYREPPGIAYQSRKEVSDAYERVARQLVAGGADVRLASQDVDLLKRLDLDCEIQMMYGVRAADQRRLAAQGKRVRVLISYGSEWFAWYMRRLAERPANVWFALRAAVGT